MGRVGAPHGVHGALKVKPASANPASLLEYGDWWLRRRGSDAWTLHRVQGIRAQGEWLVAEIAGVESRDAAGELRGADVGVRLEQLPALAEDEYYEADLVGMAVVNRDGSALGKLGAFIESGAHPIAQVIGDDGTERLIPWVGQYIDGVDVNDRRIDVDWPVDE